MDSSSIEVNRRSRRVNCDRLDAGKLLNLLMRYDAGEEDAWSVVRAPDREDEDARHRHRELLTLKRDQTRHTNRIKGLLAGCGLKVEVDRHLTGRLATLRLWDGSALASELQRRLERQSALSQWYEQRFGGGSTRLRKSGIVALARKLLVKLWQYLQWGAIPDGAVLKT